MHKNSFPNDICTNILPALEHAGWDILTQVEGFP